MFNFLIRRATTEDKKTILSIAHQYRRELGYVHPVALVEHIQRGTVYAAEWRESGQVVGFVDFHQPGRGANKGYSVVYHLAVHRDFLRRDIGRMLLYAVPCPIRLKCTVGNPANEFYKAAGMRLAGTEAGKKQALNIYEMSLLYEIIQGNNKQIPRIAKAGRMAYGVRHIEKPRVWPFALDIHWQNYEWSHYLSLVEQYRPVQALVADYERQGQREIMLRQVDDLRRLGILRILVCPKFDGAIKDIPSDCIIAVSVPSSYAGYVPPLLQLNKRLVHLLGGSPHRQKKLLVRIRGAGGIVISADGNSITKVGKFAKVWNGRWVSLKRKQAIDYYEDLVFSARNIQREMQVLADVKQLSLF